MIRIPQITNLETAIRIYYECPRLANVDIKKLFGPLCGAKIAKMKEAAREKMREENVPIWNVSQVDTAAAYKAWGLDIDNLVSRYKKLSKLNLN